MIDNDPKHTSFRIQYFLSLIELPLTTTTSTTTITTSTAIITTSSTATLSTNSMTCSGTRIKMLMKFKMLCVQNFCILFQSKSCSIHKYFLKQVFSIKDFVFTLVELVTIVIMFAKVMGQQMKLPLLPMFM